MQRGQFHRCAPNPGGLIQTTAGEHLAAIGPSHLFSIAISSDGWRQSAWLQIEGEASDFVWPSTNLGIAIVTNVVRLLWSILFQYAVLPVVR